MISGGSSQNTLGGRAPERRVGGYGEGVYSSPLEDDSGEGVVKFFNIVTGNGGL